METNANRVRLYGIILAALLFTQAAHAFYNPSTGRWLSRDPSADLAFKTTVGRVDTAARSKPVDLWLYGFVANNPTRQIDALGLMCEDPCGWAVAQGGKDTGVVVCCNGKKYGCVIYLGGSTGATDPTARRIITLCVQAHEDTHVSDPTLPCPKRCFLQGQYSFAEWPNAQPALDGECSAYKVKLYCLESGRDDCEGDPTCVAQVDAEISHVQRKIIDKCGAPLGAKPHWPLFPAR